MKLLSPGTSLCAIAVEGTSARDTTDEAGETVIDLAEYYGSEDLGDAQKVIYRQLKHSTTQATKPWAASWLKKTIVGFAAKHMAIAKERPTALANVVYEVNTNRPATPAVHEALQALADGQPPSHSPTATYIYDELVTTLRTPERVREFCSQVVIRDDEPNLGEIDKALFADVLDILPGSPADAPLMLRDMITERATSARNGDHVVRRSTVLGALKASPDQLLPAPNMIEAPPTLIETSQLRELVDELWQPRDGAMIVHAPGGHGKTMLTVAAGRHLPAGSLMLTYDCFGNGSYRRASSPRHEYRQGLVQLANELAGTTLTMPLIPSNDARQDDYLKAFGRRVQAVAAALDRTQPGALLVLAVDAADNAVLAGQQVGSSSFVPDLISETVPANVRLLITCRTERVELLKAPPDSHLVQLKGFDPGDSRAHLRARFPAATDAEAAEFHARTGGNPRVQALVLSDAVSVHEALSALGEALEVDADVLDGLLEKRVARLRDAHHLAFDEVAALCRGLATLRPRIPVRVLADLAGVTAAVARSFAADLGKPLLIDGDSIQFRDEPTETWFRKRWRPESADLQRMLVRLAELALSNAYAAGALPQLLWEADRVDELIELALSDRALPAGNPLDSLEIARQRTQFALKACLRAGRDAVAAQLALKASQLSAGHTRRMQLFRDNTDMASYFLDAPIIEDLLATRALNSPQWPNSHLPYEAALLATAPGLADVARSRLRSAQEWVQAWTQRPSATTRDYRISSADIAEVCWAHVNTAGPAACSEYLARWRPTTLGWDVGLHLARRLLEDGRVDDAETLMLRPGRRSKYLQLAVCQAASVLHQPLSAEATRVMLSVLRKQRRVLVPNPSKRSITSVPEALSGILWVVAHGLRYDQLSPAQAAALLRLYVPSSPPPSTGSRHGPPADLLMRGWALLARVENRSFDMAELLQRPAGPDVVPARSSERQQDIDRDVIPLGPWVAAWVAATTGAHHEPDEALGRLITQDRQTDPRNRPSSRLLNSVALIVCDLMAAPGWDADARDLAAWLTHNVEQMSDATLLHVTSCASRTPATQNLALATAQAFRERIEMGNDDAGSKAGELMRLARATLQFDRDEARAHFERAVEVTDQIGDDGHLRWRTLLSIAQAAAPLAPTTDAPRARRLADLCERVEPVLGDAAVPTSTLSAIGALGQAAALSIGAQWRDRRVLDLQSIVFALVDGEASPLAVTPVGALAFLPMCDRLDAEPLMHRAVPATTVAEADLRDVVSPFNPRASAPEYETERSSQDYEFGPQFDASAARPQEVDLTGFDLATSAGWEEGRRAVSERRVINQVNDLIDQVVKLPPNMMRASISAFTENPSFGPYAHRHMLDLLVSLPGLPFAAQRARTHLAMTSAKRFFREIALRDYDTFDLNSLSVAAGQDPTSIMTAALMQAGTLPDPLNAEDCLALAVRLTRRVTPAEASEVLDHAMAMFDDAGRPVPPSPDPDLRVLGAQPTVTRSVPQAAAAFVWTALGDPDPTYRWRAAHTVRLLVALRCSEELDALAGCALDTVPPRGFTDPRLHFYDKHALQWLLFAVDRCAHDRDSSTALRPFIPVLTRVLEQGDRHVVMTHSAMSALRVLRGAGVELPPSALYALDRPNRPHGIIERNIYERKKGEIPAVPPLDRARILQHPPLPDPPHSGINPAPADSDAAGRERFSFFYDFRDHWCDSVADAFGISNSTVQELVESVIVDVWASPHRGRPEDDARHHYKLYERRTFQNKSEWPEEEDLDFYLAIHALYVTAGHLADHLPVTRSPHSTTDELDQFLNEHGVTREDGRWLSDRADPMPSIRRIAGPQRGSGRQWLHSFDPAQADALLHHDAGWLTVWQDSGESDRTWSQHVSIRSALVHPATSASLLRATNPPNSSLGLWLPSSTDEVPEDIPEWFRLRAWVDDHHRRPGRDARDPHGGGALFPPPRPTPEFLEVLGLSADDDQRRWTNHGAVAARSEVWPRESHSHGHNVDGTRLQATHGLVSQLVVTTGMHLVIMTMINRSSTEENNSRRIADDDFSNYSQWARTFVFST